MPKWYSTITLVWPTLQPAITFLGMTFKFSNPKLVIVHYLKNFPSLLFFVYVQLEVATWKFGHSFASCQMATEDMEETSLLLYLAFYVSCISCFIDSLLSSKARTKTDQIFNDPNVDPRADPYMWIPMWIPVWIQVCLVLVLALLDKRKSMKHEIHET